jgi:hypothetical protein
MFCKKEGKWTKVPYVKLLFFLTDHAEWLCKFKLDTQTMVTFCKKPQNSLEEQKNPCDVHQLPLFPLTQLPHTSDIIPQVSTPSN